MAPQQPKDEELLAALAENLSRVLRKKGYTSAEQFCWDNGLSKSTVSRILRGKAAPSLINLYRISTLLGVSLDKLLKKPVKGIPKKSL